LNGQQCVIFNENDCLDLDLVRQALGKFLPFLIRIINDNVGVSTHIKKLTTEECKTKVLG
jgi:hypothetical protein